jgi:hypothetical protein
MGTEYVQMTLIEQTTGKTAAPHELKLASRLRVLLRVRSEAEELTRIAVGKEKVNTINR